MNAAYTIGSHINGRPVDPNHPWKLILGCIPCGLGRNECTALIVRYVFPDKLRDSKLTTIRPGK
jgi:hypothetical protein